MKLRGGEWVSDESDAMALAAALNASTAGALKAEAPPRRLLRCARNDEPLSNQVESALPFLVTAQGSYARI